MEYVTLLGAEDVSRAAMQMASAAADMQRAASVMADAAMRIERATQDAALLMDRMDAIRAEIAKREGK